MPAFPTPVDASVNKTDSDNSDASHATTPTPTPASESESTSGSIWNSDNWWDGVGSHQDQCIDLVGTSTDHLPDVRMYLIILGSDEEPPASKVTEEDKDDWRLARGKVILREAWRLGQGAFLDPTQPGRDYSCAVGDRDGDDVFPVRGVPWYDDLRVRKERAIGYGDAGLIPHPLTIFKDNWDMHDEAQTKQGIMKTNLRCPLPPKQLVTNPPTDRQSWKTLIEILYYFCAHPAGQALNCEREQLPSELDYEKLWHMGRLLRPEWHGEFYIEGEDDDEW